MRLAVTLVTAATEAAADPTNVADAAALAVASAATFAATWRIGVALADVVAVAAIAALASFTTSADADTDADAAIVADASSSSNALADTVAAQVAVAAMSVTMPACAATVAAVSIVADAFVTLSALAVAAADAAMLADTALVRAAAAVVDVVQVTVAATLTMPPATTPSSPSGAAASGVNPSICYSMMVSSTGGASGLTGQMMSRGKPACSVNRCGPSDCVAISACVLDDLQRKAKACAVCGWVAERECRVFGQRVAERISRLTVNRGGIRRGSDSVKRVIVACGGQFTTNTPACGQKVS
jgi:hypothetical protein